MLTWSLKSYMTRGRFNLCDVWVNHQTVFDKCHVQLLQELSAVWRAFEEYVLHKIKDQIMELLDQEIVPVVDNFREKSKMKLHNCHITNLKFVSLILTPIHILFDISERANWQIG